MVVRVKTVVTRRCAFLPRRIEHNGHHTGRARAVCMCHAMRRRDCLCKLQAPRVWQARAGHMCMYSSRRLACNGAAWARLPAPARALQGPTEPPTASQGCGQVGALAIAHAQHQAPGMRQALHQRDRARLPQAQALQVLLRHACMPARPVRPRCIAPWAELAWHNTGHAMKVAFKQARCYRKGTLPSTDVAKRILRHLWACALTQPQLQSNHTHYTRGQSH